MRLASGTLRRRRLLLVDPDAVYRAGLEEPLEAALWTVQGHPDAASALAWLEENPTCFVDAVWCEASIPDSTGPDFVARVRDHLHPGVPAMIVSATEPPSQIATGTIRAFSKKETASAVRWLFALGDEDAFESNG